MSKDVVYISCPMKGLPELNRPAFMEAEEKLTKSGCVVLNPAMLPVGMLPWQYMPICLAMLQASDWVYLLPGWRDSMGARIEHAYALYQCKSVQYPEEE